MFYKEFYESEKEDSIWDEIKYWLKNPITEAEQAERDNEINNYINAVLENVYGD